jgi:glycosyltransferase involved in cell wall biosynthesis
MKILLVTQYFWPETFIISDIVKKIASAGHSVTVLTGKPNYPDGKIFPGYQRTGITREPFCENVEIIRVPMRLRGNNRGIDLALNYLSFMISGFMRFPKLIKYENFDLVFALQLSPVTSVIPAIRISRNKKIPLVTWIQDLWPESLAATGHIRNPLVLWCIGKMVTWIYHQCDLILVQSRAFISHVQKYASDANVVYYGNSIRIDLEKPHSNAEELKRQLGKVFSPRHFNLLFAGNIGKAQAIETLLRAAVLLKDEPKFRLVLVGSGSLTSWLQQKIAEHGLTNIHLAGRFSQEHMPFFYERADALVVSLKREEIFALTVPTKIQSYLSAGKPIIASLDGEGARIITEAGAGITCGAEDAESLAICARSLMRISHAKRRTMGRHGKEYFMQHYEMNNQVKRLLKILQDFLLSAQAAHGQK